MGYKTIPSVNNYTPSGITPTSYHHLRYVVDIPVGYIKGDNNHPYEGSSKIPYRFVEGGLKVHYVHSRGVSLTITFFARFYI